MKALKLSILALLLVATVDTYTMADGAYPHPTTTFSLRQNCRNLIQKRLDDYDIEFQHADLEEPYTKGRMTGWKSWYKRNGEKQWFICVHDAQTDYVSLVLK